MMNVSTQVNQATEEQNVLPGRPETLREIRERYEFLKGMTSAKHLSDLKNKINEVIEGEHVDPKLLLETLSTVPALAFLLQQGSRMIENYTIAEHESCWLSTFERYMAGTKLPLPLSDAEIRLLGALHDIGKSLPNDKADQAQYTIQVIMDFREGLPIDPAALRIICSVIGNDPLGRFVVANFERQASIPQRQEIGQAGQLRPLNYDELKTFANLVKLLEPDRKIQENAAVIGAEIRHRARALNIPNVQLYNMHLVSYLADVGSYTYDAVAFNGKRMKPGIEFVFDLNPCFKIGEDDKLLTRDPIRGIPALAPQVARLFALIEAEVNRINNA